jgi:hypothetical protein
MGMHLTWRKVIEQWITARTPGAATLARAGETALTVPGHGLDGRKDVYSDGIIQDTKFRPA